MYDFHEWVISLNLRSRRGCQQDMYMIWQYHPGVQCIPLTIKVEERILHNLSQTRIFEMAAAVTFI